MDDIKQNEINKIERDLASLLIYGFIMDTDDEFSYWIKEMLM